MGIPHRLVVGDRGLAAGMLEYRHRRAAESTEIPAAEAVAHVRNRFDR
jgi:prolyl-tRNA synthetase